MKAKVETNVSIIPGQTILGQISGSPASPVPLPGSMTKEGTGVGVGEIS